jgi:hypothetical protein
MGVKLHSVLTSSILNLKGEGWHCPSDCIKTHRFKMQALIEVCFIDSDVKCAEGPYLAVKWSKVLWAGYVACMIKMRNAEKLKKPLGISELKGKIRVWWLCQKMGCQELDWIRGNRNKVFPRVINVCTWNRMTWLNAQHSFLCVRSAIQISAQKGTVMPDVSQ